MSEYKADIKMMKAFSRWKSHFRFDLPILKATVLRKIIKMKNIHINKEGIKVLKSFPRYFLCYAPIFAYAFNIRCSV